MDKPRLEHPVVETIGHATPSLLGAMLGNPAVADFEAERIRTGQVDAARTQTTHSITDLTGYHRRGELNLEADSEPYPPRKYSSGVHSWWFRMPVNRHRLPTFKASENTRYGLWRLTAGNTFIVAGASTGALKLYSFADTLGQFTIPQSSFGRFGLHLGPPLQPLEASSFSRSGALSALTYIYLLDESKRSSKREPFVLPASTAAGPAIVINPDATPPARY
ncbi:hypothetical protein DFH08DRAFT_812741 [Mycena albidolilacea]|uniref:Uncharacterized protein n=1 Tax=Mycena albidolilacea TaxID=1033008 RepID=A0AAD6ZSN4_9AGAR|nr:hypothetical protein DFH08DRAFT_812741 [Mycena albidolilacea]